MLKVGENSFFILTGSHSFGNVGWVHIVYVNLDVDFRDLEGMQVSPISP